MPSATEVKINRIGIFYFCHMLLLLPIVLLISCGGCSPIPPVESGTSTTYESQVENAPRFALLIGNSSYRYWGDGGEIIPTAEADVEAMASILTRARFTLIGGGPQINVTSSRQVELIRKLRAELRKTPGATVIFYFSGHGFSIHGRNMLAAVDVGTPKPNDVGSDEASVTEIATSLAQSGAGTVLMFLDSCRDSTTEEIGFGDEPAPKHTFIEFGSYFGTSSLVLSHRAHSAFTQALLISLKIPWKTLEELYNLSAVMVALDTNTRQVPVYRSDSETLHLRLHIFPANEANVIGQTKKSDPNPEVSLAASKCAADGDFRLMMKNGVSIPSGPEGLSLSILGPSASPREVFDTCRKAIGAGARDPSVLRGAAIATIAALSLQLKPGPTDAEITSWVGWLYQAAEQGDPVAESFVAWLESGSYDFKSASIDPGRASKRALHAAETGKSPFGALIAMALISGTNSKALPFDFKIDRNLGFSILAKSVEQSDQMALQISYLYLLDERKGRSIPGLGSLLQQLKTINLRRFLMSNLESPRRNSGIMAVVIPGLSAYQTLNSFMLQDYFLGISGPPDLTEFVRLAVIAEPWFPQYEKWVSVSSVSSSYVVGCALLGGLHFNNGEQRVPRNNAVGKRFLMLAAKNGNPEARKTLDTIRLGTETSCSIDGDYLSARLSRLVN